MLNQHYKIADYFKIVIPQMCSLTKCFLNVLGQKCLGCKQTIKRNS